MNLNRTRDRHLVPSKIPMRVWVAFAVAMGVLVALLMVLAIATDG
jgi:hypothetical protein